MIPLICWCLSTMVIYGCLPNRIRKRMMEANSQTNHWASPSSPPPPLLSLYPSIHLIWAQFTIPFNSQHTKEAFPPSSSSTILCFSHFSSFNLKFAFDTFFYGRLIWHHNSFTFCLSGTKIISPFLFYY